MKSRILVIGNTYLEEEFTAEKMPSAGYFTYAQDYMESICGAGAEAAFVMSKLSGSAILLGRLGEDPGGVRIRSFYRDKGVDTRFLSLVKGEKTGVFLRVKDSTGERELCYPGANATLTMKDAERAFSCSPEAVYLSLDVPYEVAIASSRFAKMKRIPLFLSATGIHKDFPFDLLEGVDTVFLNEASALAYTGYTVAGVEGCNKVALDMHSRIGARCVVIKRAQKGIFFSADRYHDVALAYAMQKADKSFADAAFDAAFITYYLENRVYKHACEYANIVSTLTASRAGKLSSVPDHNETMRFAAVNCPQLPIKEKQESDDDEY